jgi:hypothetical protein
MASEKRKGAIGALAWKTLSLRLQARYARRPLTRQDTYTVAYAEFFVLFLRYGDQFAALKPHGDFYAFAIVARFFDCLPGQSTHDRTRNGACRVCLAAAAHG